MYFRKFPLLFLVFAASYYSYAQGQKSILKDTARIWLKAGTDAENARFIIQILGSKEIRHTPNDIPGYRLRNGRTYTAFTIQASNGESERYFFERLSNGAIKFYYLVDRNNRQVYYMSVAGSELKELSQEDFHEVLKKATEHCPGVSENARYVKLTRYHLARYSEDYDRCSNRAFPRFRGSVKAEINHITYHQQEAQESTFFPLINKFSAIGSSLGGSIDYPIAVSNLSLNAGLTLTYYHGSGEGLGYEKIYSVAFTDLHVSLPVGLRYSLYGSLVNPFIEADVIYSQHLSGSTALYEFERNGNAVFLSKREGFLFVPKQQLGFGLSAGAIIFPRKKHSIQLQGNYKMMRPLSSSMISTHINVMSLSVGFMF